MKNIIFITLANICILFIGCKSESDPSQLRIAYNVLVDPNSNDYDIFLMDLDGKNPTNISNNEYIDWVYSAYSDKLYIISDRDTCTRCYFLYETDTKGTYWNKISKTLIQDSWVSVRAEGTELIIKPAGTAYEVFQIIDLQGNILSTVDPKMDYFNDPCFSPDGSSIIFRGYNGDLSRSNEAELYSFNLTSQEKKKITNYPPNTSTFGNFQYYAGPPRWSPKYGKITYSSSSNNHSRIKAIDTIKIKPKSLTGHNIKSIWHDISPDGRYLTFDGQLDFKADSASSDIFIIDFDLRSATKLTIGNGYKQGPVFVYEK